MPIVVCLSVNGPGELLEVGPGSDVPGVRGEQRAAVEDQDGQSRACQHHAVDTLIRHVETVTDV